MTLQLGTLVEGVYTVKWRALWPADGHTTSGFFVFAVGRPVPAGQATSGGGAGTLDPLRVAVRWIGYVAAMLLAGTAIFQAGLLRPSLLQLDLQAAGRVGAAASRRLRALTVTSALALLLSVIVEFGLQATTLLDASLAQVVRGGMLWPLLGGTKSGWSVLLRGSMALLLLLPASPRGRMTQTGALAWILLFGGVAALTGGPAALLATGVHALPILLSAHVYAVVLVMMGLIVPTVPGVRVPEMRWTPAFAGPVLLAGITISSHAAGSGLLAMFVDWVHLLAAGAWVGGLASLLLVLTAAAPVDRGALAQVLVPRFSKLAGWSLAVVVATGVYSSVVHLPSLRAFVITAYGQTLLLKLFFILLLVGLGAFNRFVLRPRLSGSPATPHSPLLRRFARAVTGEVGLGAVVLLIVAVLTITPPPRSSRPALGQKPLILSALAGDVQLRLTVTPAAPGWNRFEITGETVAGTPIPGDARLLLRLTKLDEDVEPVTVLLESQAPGRYAAEGGELALSGWWQVEVVVRRRGRLDVSTMFPLALAAEQISTSDQAAARLLQTVVQASTRVRTWRQVEQLTDGTGGGAVSAYEWVRPDRVRITGSGSELIIIGGTRWQRVGSGPWERAPLPQPLRVSGPLQQFVLNSDAVALGREGRCEDEPCRVVLWTVPGGETTFAAWIGSKTRYVHRLFMIAPSHYMTVRYFDFNTNLRVRAPQ